MILSQSALSLIAVLAGLVAWRGAGLTTAIAQDSWPIIVEAGVLGEGARAWPAEDSTEPKKPSGDASEKLDEPADRPLGSAFFGGDGTPRVFAPLAESTGDPKSADTSPWPDITKPGPDLGDFPNSAFTLPKGRAQVEFSPVTLLNADRQAPAAYITQFLLRYGLTDNVEFRLFGNGVTHIWGPNPTTGFSPLNLDLKVHLWNDRKEWLIPAMSLEVFLLTTWGSSQFDGGWQPALNLNFDLPIAKKLNLEWTLGYHGTQEAINVHTLDRFVPRFNFLIPGVHRVIDLNFNQFSAQWALEYEVNDTFQVFFHGFHNGSVLLNLGAGEMVGIGAFWKLSPRLLAFGSINTGLTPDLPSCAGQIGFALAL
jgi:hypothetical protein